MPTSRTRLTRCWPRPSNRPPRRETASRPGTQRVPGQGRFEIVHRARSSLQVTLPSNTPFTAVGVRLQASLRNITSQIKVRQLITWACLFFATQVAPWTLTPSAAAPGNAVWVRLELVENSAEGPAYPRCQIEAILEPGRTARWRVLYGEVHSDAAAGWAGIRSGARCEQLGSDLHAVANTMRGSPFFSTEVELAQPRASGRELHIDAALTVQRLTGFSKDGTPTYDTKTEKRVLRVPEGSSSVLPILAANQKERDEFQVRELILKFRAGVAGSHPPVEYGEISVAADVPRAEIFLDGGLVGRTSSQGPVTLAPVRIGDREVVVRDASGREARTVARIEKGRRSSLSLTLLKSGQPSSAGLRPLGRNPQGGQEFWRDKDGAIVVRIPGGEFKMGSPDGQGEPSEHPQHVVRLKTFLIDKTEVTWGQFRRFSSESKMPLPKPPIWGMLEEMAVSDVTWGHANAFCAWAGGRLPTEAEWERAARGDDSREYPWGNNWVQWRCNTRDGGPHAPTAAGAYADCASPYGVLDLAGGVSEWCSDWYDEKYYARSPLENPTGPETGVLRVVRGGTWMSPSFSTRSAVRQGIEPGFSTGMKGFRCAQDDPEAIGK